MVMLVSSVTAWGPFVSVEESGWLCKRDLRGYGPFGEVLLGCGAYVDNTILHDAFHEELDLAVERAGR